MGKVDIFGGKPSIETLSIRQNYSLGAKVVIAEQRIREWYELSIWREQDIWAYIKKFDIPVCSIYALGYERTGCVFCGFGCHMKSVNQFELLKKTHPTLYSYCMDKLGMKEVLDWYPKRMGRYVYEEDIF